MCMHINASTAIAIAHRSPRSPGHQITYLPVSPLVLAPGDSLDSHQNVRLKPLRPKEGRFLPVLAALSGQLYLEPAGYYPTQHDVIQLDRNVLAMQSQGGYISCLPRPEVRSTETLGRRVCVHAGCVWH